MSRTMPRKMSTGSRSRRSSTCTGVEVSRIVLRPLEAPLALKATGQDEADEKQQPDVKSDAAGAQPLSSNVAPKTRPKTGSDAGPEAGADAGSGRALEAESRADQGAVRSASPRAGRSVPPTAASPSRPANPAARPTAAPSTGSGSGGGRAPSPVKPTTPARAPVGADGPATTTAAAPAAAKPAREIRAEPTASAAASTKVAAPAPPAAATPPAATSAARSAPGAAPAGEFASPPELDASAEFAELLPPQFIDNWDPDAPAPPPAKAPPGDSRSFRRQREGSEEFILVYRHKSYLIIRAGKVGTLGTWTIKEYPSLGAAAHAYAQECSEFTHIGYRDLR